MATQITYNSSAVKQPAVIWHTVISFLSVVSSANLAGTNCTLREILRKSRFGCRRCGKWMRVFTEDGDSAEYPEIYSLDCTANFFGIGHEMFCACGAIHNFCTRCYYPSTFTQHCGMLAAQEPMELSKAVSLAALPGLGIALSSIIVRQCGDTEVLRSKPGVPIQLRQTDKDGTDIELPDVDDDVYTQFYIGDLDREYAIADEYIGDTLYHFGLNGPDGGMGTHWHCKRCDFHYCVTDK